MHAPPLLVSYPDTVTFLKALRLAESSDAKTFTTLAEGRLPPVVTVAGVAALFGYTRPFVMSMVNKPVKHYRSFFIHTGSKKRRIDAPRVGLKVVQKWLGHHLGRSIELPDCVHGFVPNRSTVTAAEHHLGKKWVLSVDVKDFFPSITRARVVEALVSAGYNERGANLVASLTTLKDALPQGSPASPSLANLIFVELDRLLESHLRKSNCAYTRYADDIVVSGNSDADPNLILKQVEQLIASHGWCIASKKTHIQIKPDAQRVHGMVVHGDRLRLPKEYRNTIRRMKYALDHFELDPKTHAVFSGHIAYASSVYSGEIESL